VGEAEQTAEQSVRQAEAAADRANTAARKSEAIFDKSVSK
jgi:hypothetical protein